MIVKRVFFLVLIVIVLAIFEIQIEGASGGWAKNLPCWRAVDGSWQQIVYGLVMNGKPCDGFHLTEIALLLLMFHLPFVYDAKWSLVGECEILTNFFTVSICWDFLWFIFNPAFGWSKFNAANIWWHMKWIGPFPADYYSGLAMIVAFAILAGLLSKNWLTTKIIAIDSLAIIGLTAVIAILTSCLR